MKARLNRWVYRGLVKISSVHIGFKENTAFLDLWLCRGERIGYELRGAGTAVAGAAAAAGMTAVAWHRLRHTGVIRDETVKGGHLPPRGFMAFGTIGGFFSLADRPHLFEFRFAFRAKIFIYRHDITPTDNSLADLTFLIKLGIPFQ
jgi:hypothetical protein